MARLPYAAEQLIAEVQDLDENFTAETVGDPDGLGVYRSIRFDKAASEQLAEVGEVLTHDERIVSVENTDDGVVFTFDERSMVADDRTEFGVEHVVSILEGPEEPTEEEEA